MLQQLVRFPLLFLYLKKVSAAEYFYFIPGKLRNFILNLHEYFSSSMIISANNLT